MECKARCCYVVGFIVSCFIPVDVVCECASRFECEFLTGQQLAGIKRHRRGAVTPLLCKSILHEYTLVHTCKTGTRLCCSFVVHPFTETNSYFFT